MPGLGSSTENEPLIIGDTDLSLPLVKTTTVSYVPYPVVITRPNTLAYAGVVKVMGVVEVEVVVVVEVVVTDEVKDGLVVFLHPL
jgi:hypothetical protein